MRMWWYARPMGGSTMRIQRFTVVSAAVAALGLVLLAASAAAAAVPANADIDAAVPVTALPFQATADTTQPTLADDDPSCVGGDDHTVWYDLTLASNTQISVDTTGSDYDTTLS